MLSLKPELAYDLHQMWSAHAAAKDNQAVELALRSVRAPRPPEVALAPDARTLPDRVAVVALPP
jgi:hypothetical protein